MREESIMISLNPAQARQFLAATAAEHFEKIVTDDLITLKYKVSTLTILVEQVPRDGTTEYYLTTPEANDILTCD